MADANARINIDINTSEAAAALRSLQSQITAFNSTLTKSSAVQATAMRNSTQNMLELVNASRFFSAEQVKMQTAASSLDKTLSKGQVTIGQYLGARFRKNTLAAAQVMSLAQTRASALQTQFVATGVAANGMRDAIAIRPLQAFNNAAVVSAQKLAIQRAMLQQATTQMINFGKNTQWAGRQLMVGFTVPLTIFAGVAGKTFMDLEREAVNFKKVYGDSFTPPEEMQANLDAVKELAKEYTKYGIAVKDTVGLAAEAAAAGAQNAELLDATTQATRLATLGQMEQNEALKTTISLQNAFKLSGDDLANSINFLNMVENQTVVTLQDLSGAIPRVAPVIKGLGGDVRDLATFLAAMQEGGVSAAQGAMALKSGLASLINPTDKAKEKLAEMGISIDTIIQANKGDLMGTVQALATALDTLDQFGRQQAIEQLFGKFQYARLAALFDNINKEGTQAARVMEITAMSAAEMAASAEKELSAIEEAVGTKFTAAMEKLQLAIAPIGELFLKMAIPVVNFFTSVIDKFNQLPDFAKTFSAFAAVIIGIVIPTGTMFLGLLMNLVGTLIKFGALVGTAFKGFTSGGFKGAFDAVSQSLKYMSLAELDAVNSAQQLAGSTEAVNQAFLEQVTASDGAQAAIMELSYAYEILTQQMREAAIQNQMVFGVGATAMGAAGARGPRVRRNRGGTIPGSGNTDTVPAMLTPGEFVVNKQATQQNLPLLKAINKGNVQGFNLGGAVIGSRLLAAAASARSRPLASTIGRTSVSLPSPVRSSGVSTVADISSRLIKGRTQVAKISSVATQQEMSTIPVKGLGALVLRLPGTSLNQKLNRKGLTGPEAAQAIAQSGLSVDDIFEPFELQRRAYVNSRGMNPSDLSFNKDSAYSKLLTDLNSYPGNIKDDQFAMMVRNSIKPYLSGEKATDFMNALTRARALKVSKTVGEKNEDFARRIQSQLSTMGSTAKITTKVSGRKTRVFFNKDGVQVEITPDYEFGYLADLDDGLYDYTELRKQLRSVKGTQLTHANSGGYIVPGQGNKDTVPAMLTPGEFVINKQATQSNRALLEAINNGEIKGYRKGGHVQTQNIQGVRSFVVLDEQGQEVGRFSTQKEANKALRSYRRQTRISRVSGAMRGGRGMGIGMGMGMLGSAMFMGSGMMPNQGASTAMQVGGTALGIGSMIPMMGGMGGMGAMLAPLAGIAAPAAAVAAGLAVAGIAAYKWRDSVDSAARKAAEFGSNLGGTANAFNQIASLMGTQTPAQRQAALQMGFGEEEQVEIAQEFQNIFGSEQGQAFIKDLEEATSEERFKKLSDYLRAGIASGIMDKETATGLAKAVSLTIGDTILGAKTVGAITRQETGAAAVADIAQARADNVSSLKEFTRVVKEEGILLDQADAAKIIGGSIQTIQDFSNASALAREQLANGEITQAEYNKIIEQSESQQALFTKAIEESLMHTTDFGGTMQGTLDQLTKAGLATEEGLNKLREAAEAASFSNVVGEVGTQQGLMAAGVSAIAAGMGEATVAETVSLIGEVGSAAQIAFENLYGEVGGAQALQGAALVSQISTGQMFGESVAPIQQDILAANAERFAREGGDIVGLQSILLSQASLEDRVNLAEDFFTLSDSDQNQLITDYQNLASTLGTEFSNKIIQSSDYEEALAAGTTDEFVRSITEASTIFGDKTQEMMDYAEKTGQSFSTLTQYGKDIQDLGQEAIFRLGIDITNPKDLEKFGPIADSLSKNWPILENLNKEINMSAYLEFLTVDEKGNPLSAKQVYENTKDLNRAWREAGNLEDIEARKSAIFELRTLQNGVQMPLESYNTIWNDLIEEYGKKVIQKLPTSVLTKVISLELQLAASESSVKAAKEALATGNLTGSDRAFANAIVAREGQAASQIRTEMEQDIYGSAFGPPPSTTGSRGGGGGTPEKTIAQQLAEQRKLITAQEKYMMGGKGQKVMAGPFGQEFLDYLKSQGQKGVDLMKKPFKEIQKIQKDFAVSQRKEIRIATMAMPDAIAKELKGRKDRVRLENQLVTTQNVSLDVAKEIVASLEDQQVQDYLRLDALKDGNKSQREYAANLEDIVDNSKDLVKYNKENALIEKYRAMTADELKSAQFSVSQTINDLNRQIKELEIISPLQEQLEAQQKVVDGISRTIELRQRDIDLIGRTIELKQREIEPIDDAIEKLEEQQTKIEEYYDSQIEALDDVAQAEENLARIREGRLDIAGALSRGDVAGAAQAAVEMRRRFAEQQQEATRGALEKRRQQEIDQIQGNIKQKQEERKKIEEEIKNLELDQRNIQDEIYNLQQSMIPVQDEIYRLNKAISDEAEKLDDQYNNAKLQAEALKHELYLAKLEAQALAAAMNMKADAQERANSAAAQAPINTGEAPSVPFTGWNNEFADNPIMIYSPEQISANIAAMGGYKMGGSIKKYAMGGMINYKGSREPAPGFMMGGKVKKFAFGDFVPGRGMTDKVPAMLTPGEFVVRKPVAEKFKPMLQSLNSQVFPGMGVPQQRSLTVSAPQFDTMKRMSVDKVRYGIPQSINSFTYPTTNMNITQSNTDISPNNYNVGPTNVQYTYNLNISTETDASPDDIANTVMYRIKRFEDRRIKGTEIG